MTSIRRLAIAGAAALAAACPGAFAQQGSGPSPAVPPGVATPAQPPGGVSATQSATQTQATTADQTAVGRGEQRTNRAARAAKDKVK